ncbi:hypothetical protein [Acidisoma silvae]|uniref:Uncharacterized protein n=1 Tax=Acidisoma silvae TaxID=2802396 RepID=A0A963YV15_9PROT|nr:hypothetical protein [Acidisoma silvae]MCB8877596.1 hypothetical protein [Acidisoma silvae]
MSQPTSPPPTPADEIATILAKLAPADAAKVWKHMPAWMQRRQGQHRFDRRDAAYRAASEVLDAIEGAPSRLTSSFRAKRLAAKLGGYRDSWEWKTFSHSPELPPGSDLLKTALHRIYKIGDGSFLKARQIENILEGRRSGN